ncbi:MAG: glutathione S-transferase family protein [Parvibaculaceae bacterium]|nr:glutathione S-transferase family protein [Parvibaculaceae bacterium]
MTGLSNAIIFHQYDISPFSEKVRTAFAIKGLEWYAVNQPVIMPKPELLALTGGYRKIPVMQIGADIYCDSQIILRELERRFPTPSLHVGEDKGLSWGLGMWTDRTFFQTVIPIIFGYVGKHITPEFKQDREAMSGRPFDVAAMAAAAPLMADQLRAQIDWLEAQLGDGRPFLLGEKPGLADVNVYYNFAFVRWSHPGALDFLKGYPHVAQWEARIKNLGHGERKELSREDALDIARDAAPMTEPYTDEGEPNGLKTGDNISVMADDYGRDPIRGELVSSSAQHIALKRTDPRVGEVVVHFPRAGFFVMKG